MPERLVSILCLLLSVSVHVSLQNLVSQNTKYQSWLSMVAMISVMSNGWQGYFVFSTFQVQWESPRSPGVGWQNGQVFLLRGLTLAVSSNFFTIKNMMPSCHGNGGKCEELYARQSFNNVSFPRAFPLSVIQNAFTDRLRVSCKAHRNIFISMHFGLTMTDQIAGQRLGSITCIHFDF